jgi:hypothetical protein
LIAAPLSVMPASSATAGAHAPRSSRSMFSALAFLSSNAAAARMLVGRCVITVSSSTSSRLAASLTFPPRSAMVPKAGA